MKRSDEQLKNLQSLKAQDYISSLLIRKGFPHLGFTSYKVVYFFFFFNFYRDLSFDKNTYSKNKSINRIILKSKLLLYERVSY